MTIFSIHNLCARFFYSLFGLGVIFAISIMSSAVFAAPSDNKGVVEVEIPDEVKNNPDLTVTKNGNVTSVNHKKNLAPNAELDCIDPDKITNQYNPPALLISSWKCVNQYRLKNAYILRMVAAAYAHFDIPRLSDVSTQDAFYALKMQMEGNINKELSEAVSNKFMEIRNDGATDKELCAFVTKLGPPQYQPDWAIYHGMQAIMGKIENPIKTDIDNDKIWKDVLSQVCSLADKAKK
ncbi:MAG: hypothetical protein ORN98_04730 [Alphaproteobacteria bacterium]|nr:hypothetical protein [Alphaproteobacteria bacterium]